MGRLARYTVVALVLLGPATGGAEDAAPGAGAGGMQAHIDPQTGGLVQEPVLPPPADVQAPQPAPPEAPRRDVHAPGGGMMVELGGSFMSDLVATVGPDGRLRIDCVPGTAPASAEPQP
jgi:hypothetical protein